jgi:hypothetical protein
MKLETLHKKNQLSFANTNVEKYRCNIFSNNELISNRFAVFVTCTHILTYL